ncbi:YggS family pyridoxal phosphate-dependent enzyme [Flavobacteriaceae bacterium F89]|uniref:Pyridoxal phosphate homeostasis protein n=1 Tax=Cerina litoralis TaxID=2874477 RepID=A0AAE3JRA2_9FLAO|nr:YggS family pyridoxal phosphate-dependent enzyme [Cerina litoralis]MCG2461113.1 YggS family pyridoxal phosphate-dependent enzyme [Cerina litoralis]
MSISENLNRIRNSLPEHVTLVAVSKTKPVSDIMEAYNAGQRIFGENKVQEMTEKWEILPKDINWHMIGHVQRNKVKYMASYVSLIHGVDSLRLLKEINKQAKKANRNIDCLLQVHIAEEESKFGLDASELSEIITSIKSGTLSNIRVLGLMGMATFTDDDHQIRKEFQNLKSLFDKTKNVVSECSILSMGMSGDYQIAIEEGSNMVRIGSRIFGRR